MNKVIKDIIDSNSSKEEKKKTLDVLIEQIEMARGILNGNFIYCPDCNDYYLAKSFFEEKETKPWKVCVYRDWINSGGDEYKDGFLDIKYRVCPKGHKHEVSRYEREK